MRFLRVLCDLGDLCVYPRSFPEKSLLCFHTLAHSFIFRIQHFSLQALCLQSLPHSFRKHGGWVSTLPKVELDTQRSSCSNLFKFFLFTLLRTLLCNGRNTTLLESIGSALFLSQWGCGVRGLVLVCLTKAFLRRCPGIGSSCLKAPVSRFASQMLFLAASRNLLVLPSVFLAKCDSFPAPSGSHIKRRRPLMSKPALKLFLGAALLTAALLLFAPLRTAAQTAKSSDSDRWIHVRIDNHESKGEMVRVNVPVELAEKVLPTINHDRLRNGRVKIDRAEMEGVDLRALLDAVRSAGKDELDLVAALHALSAQGDTELVAVKDDESTIRVWIDSKNSSD